jgi:hypothetical protein
MDDPLNDYDDDDDTAFPCACGDPSCVGHNDDAANINLCGVWYAADCAMANHHPIVVEERERDARRDLGRGK